MPVSLPLTRREMLGAVGVNALALGRHGHGLSAEPTPKAGRVEFTRLIAHWAEYADDDYLAFVAEARPEVCQIGFYGGHFYSLVHTPEYKGYPAHFPVQGIAACGKWFEQRNAAIHKLGAKVVGHFNVSFLVGEPDGTDGPRGFFKFYRELWDEQELGKKPVADPLDLMSRHADGTPMASKQYSIGQMREFTACLNNPHWRAVLKAWAKRGLARGVDGYIANYFYRHNCLCEHCMAGFRDYLGHRFTPAQLKEKFGIGDLKGHVFTEIVGWHDPKDSTPLRREMLRWSQIACKAAFDDVFVKYARGLKPGLILAQWNHLGDFNQINGDERCMLPSDLWGRDEDYLWYSTGGAAFYTDLAAGFLGEGTLQARYIRGAFDDKPFTLGKYESTRTRVSIAELAANGGAPMGFYTRHKDPEARKEIARYYRFLEKNDSVFRANRPHAEVLLLFPRSQVHGGDVASVEALKKLGKELLDSHVLFDILPDDMLTPAKAAAYRIVLDPVKPDKLPAGLSTFTAPQTLRVSASVPAAGGEIDLHFVNYNRTEPAEKKSAGGGIKDEKPIAADGVSADFVLPAGAKVAGVRVATPEESDEVEVKFTVADGRLRFAVPKFLVYSVVRVKLETAAEPVHTPVFVAGQGGYHTYRIPAAIVAPKGTVLAFCEGRKGGRGDAGDIDLVLKRSSDGGKTWGRTQIVWDDADNTCGNPCPVVDAKTGTIWLLMTHNLRTDTEAKIVAGTSTSTRTVWVTKSTDDGATWAKPVEITRDVKKPGWTWYATGPGIGIQLKSGRLLVPCDSKSDGGKVRESHVIFSDDGGKSWQLGGVVGPLCNECQAVERTDGSVMLNMRGVQPNIRRLVAVSTDGGATFTKPVEDPALIEPVCQGSILRLPGKDGGILFSNPASTKREKLTVRLSRDEGKTWPLSKVLHAGPAAYSCLTVLPGGEIGCLYERGEKQAYEEITFARFRW